MRETHIWGGVGDTEDGGYYEGLLGRRRDSLLELRSRTGSKNVHQE